MKKISLRIIGFILIISLIALTAPSVGAQTGDKEVLRFNSDGVFTILQFTDTQDTHLPSPNMLSLLQKAMDRVQPDLVVFTGDQIKNYDSDFKCGGHEWKGKLTLHHILTPVVNRGIPFVITFGNHDAWFDDFTREDQLEFVQKYKGCMVFDEAPEITGCGNCSLQILSGKSDEAVFNMFFLDSNQSVVDNDQVDWYVKRSKELAEENDGRVLPAIEFQHIVPKNDYLIDAFEERGDVIASFFGHNHNRSDSFNKKGIEFYYTPTSGFYEFGPGRDRGARVIKLYEDNPEELETYVLTFSDLFEDDPITDCRYMLFTVFELNDVSAFEVLGVISKAFIYLIKVTNGEPIQVLFKLSEFLGFDVSYYFRA